MSTAQVKVLHPILRIDGWLMPGLDAIPMDLAEAKEHEARGYVDILTVDGRAEVWQACCNGDHA